LLLTSPKAYIISENYILKKVAGITKLDDCLKRLDKMTNEEVKMATAEALRIAQDIETKVEGIDEKLGVVGERSGSGWGIPPFWSFCTLLHLFILILQPSTLLFFRRHVVDPIGSRHILTLAFTWRWARAS